MYVQTLILTLMLFAVSPMEAGRLGNHARLLTLEWKQAVALVRERSVVWHEVFRSLDVDTVECEAVIFPELLRYNRAQDGMEQTALLALYVAGGKEAANFSVGMFQMKPSFAEEVEAAWMKSPMRHEYKLYFDLSDSRELRRKRISRLSDERWQCVYLSVFVKLLMEREPSLAVLLPEERVRLLATAYNYSFTASLDKLKRRQPQKTFHLDLLPSRKTTYYVYAEIAVEWYSWNKDIVC